MQQRYRVTGFQGLEEPLGLGADALAPFQKLPGLAQIAAAAGNRRQQRFLLGLGEFGFQLPHKHWLRQGQKLQLHAAGADRGQQLVGIVGKKEEYPIGGGLLQYL